MQSLSTFSRLTAEELVHLHRHGCTAGLRFVTFQFSQFWSAKIQLVCLNQDWNLKKQFKYTDWILGSPIKWLNWSWMCFSTTVHTFHLHFAQPANQRKDSQNVPFYTCSPAARGFICNEPILLPWLLTVQMHVQILMNHIKIHTDIHRLLHHGGRLYCPILRCLERPHCDECVIACVYLLIR